MDSLPTPQKSTINYSTPKTMMNYQSQILNPHFFHICPKTTNLSPHFSIQPNPRLHKATLFTAYNILSQQQQTEYSTITTNETEISKIDAIYNVKLKTLGGCKLGISRYPDFEYDAQGGSGSGKGTRVFDNNIDPMNGEIFVDFDVSTLYIPAVSTVTTKFLGLPLPPFLNIDIVPEMLSGKINQESGQVDMKFKAKFFFSVGSIYRAAPLVVDTVLTSEEATGDLRGGRGVRLNKEGRCTLVGVAKVEPIGDFFMDSFLSLPSECLACMNATISISCVSSE